MSGIAPTTTDSSQPDHLHHEIPSGGISEKHDIHQEKYEGVALDDDDDIEDIDALIDDLESQDGAEELEEEAAEMGASAKPVPEELLQTDTRIGLTSAEVDRRQKRYGLNQMSEEKENLILKFLMYFVGPIQFVMEVRLSCILALR